MTKLTETEEKVIAYINSIRLLFGCRQFPGVNETKVLAALAREQLAAPDLSAMATRGLLKRTGQGLWVATESGLCALRELHAIPLAKVSLRPRASHASSASEWIVLGPSQPTSK